MSDALQDIRYGTRMLCKNPGFTAAAVLILAVGIGANTTIFTVVNALLFRPLPYKDAERIVYVLAGKERLANWGAASAADFEDWKAANQVFAEMALFFPDAVNLSGGNEPERVSALRISAGMMPLLGVTLVSGRPFLPEEYQPGKAPAVMVSHGLWQRRFASNSNVAGEGLRVDGIPHAIAGVLPPGFRVALITGVEPDVLLPFSPGASEDRGLRKYGVFARLKPGTTVERARRDMELIARRLQQQYPQTNAGWTVWVDTLRGEVDPIAYVLLAVLICSVLGIACTNVTNLLLTRAAAREREISIRSALGASRGRVVRQLVTESLLLAFLGCTLGVVITIWACDLIRSASAGTNVSMLDISVDQTVLGGTLVLFLLTAAAVGLLPALQASRGDLNRPLKERSSGTHSPAKRRLRNALVVSEIAVSLLLLTGAGLVIKSWLRLWQVDPGFRSARVSTMRIALSETEYPEPARQAAFFEQLLGRLENRAGVESAAVASSLPTMGPSTSYAIEGRPQPPTGEEPFARLTVVSPQYFATLAIPVKRGRAFTDADAAKTQSVIVINEAMARKHWPGQDPIGALIHVRGHARTVVGVVGDVRSVPLSLRPFPEICVPHRQSPAGQMTLVVRTAAGDPLSATPIIKGELRALNPNQPASNLQTMEKVMSSNMGVIRLGTSLLAILASGALILATVGLYGVLSCSVAQRTGEIGVRMALGARTADVLIMVLRHGAALILLGAAPGLAASVALGRLLSHRVHGISATEPGVLAGVLAVLALVSLAACYIPARRATRVDPIRALRAE
jgi:putative ABC transport system permease protein